MSTLSRSPGENAQQVEKDAGKALDTSKVHQAPDESVNVLQGDIQALVAGNLPETVNSDSENPPDKAPQTAPNEPPATPITKLKPKKPSKLGFLANQCREVLTAYKKAFREPSLIVKGLGAVLKNFFWDLPKSLLKKEELTPREKLMRNTSQGLAISELVSIPGTQFSIILASRIGLSPVAAATIGGILGNYISAVASFLVSFTLLARNTKGLDTKKALITGLGTVRNMAPVAAAFYIIDLWIPAALTSLGVGPGLAVGVYGVLGMAIFTGIAKTASDEVANTETTPDTTDKTIDPGLTDVANNGTIASSGNQNMMGNAHEAQAVNPNPQPEQAADTNDSPKQAPDAQSVANDNPVLTAETKAVHDAALAVPTAPPEDHAHNAILQLHNSRHLKEQNRDNIRTERTSPESNEFTVVKTDPKGKETREKFTIEFLDSAEHPTFDPVYSLMEEQFGSEELDPKDIMGEQMKGLRYGYDTGGQARIFAVKNEKGEVVSTLDGALLPLRDEKGQPTNEAVYFVSYVATEPAVRKYGIGREIMITAYAQAQKDAKERGLTFAAAAGECTWTSQNYWEKMGWKRVYADGGGEQPIREAHYTQPPLAFDLKTGEVEEDAGPAPEHFMVHMFGEENAKTDNATLARKLGQIVDAFNYSQSYVDRRAFNEANPDNLQAAKDAYDKHRTAIDPYSNEFKRDLQHGTVRFLSSTEVADLRKQGRVVEDYVTGDEEAAHMARKVVRLPTENL